MQLSTKRDGTMALVKCKECGNENARDAKTCPKCGTALKMGIGKKILIGLGGLFVLGLIGQAGKDGEPLAQPVQVAVAATRTPVAGLVNTPVAVSEQHAVLEFGKPTVKVEMGMTQVMVEAKNRSGTNLKGCIVTATFKKADTILGTANGAVNDMPAGVTRTAQLVSTDHIKGYDTVKLEASTCF
jgi:hypothetical protein